MEQTHALENNGTCRTHSRWHDLADKNVKIKEQIESRLQNIAQEQRMIDILRCTLITLCMRRGKNCLVLIKTRENVNISNKLKTVETQQQMQEHEQEQWEEESDRVNDDKLDNNSSTNKQTNKVNALQILTSPSSNTPTSTICRTVAYFRQHEPNNERVLSAICDPFRQASAFTHNKTAFVSYCDIPCSKSALSLRQFFECFPHISKHLNTTKRKRTPHHSMERQSINENSNKDKTNEKVKDTVNDEHFSVNMLANTATNSALESSVDGFHHPLHHHRCSSVSIDDNSSGIINNTLAYETGSTAKNLQDILNKHNLHESNNINHLTEWREFVHTNTMATKIVAEHFTDIHALLTRLLVCYAEHLLIETPQACLQEKLCSFYSLQNHHILKEQLELMTFAHVRNCDDVDLVSNSRVLMYKKLQLISLYSNLQVSTIEQKRNAMDVDILHIAREDDCNVNNNNDNNVDDADEEMKNAKFAQQASHTLLACYLACKSGVFANTGGSYNHRDTTNTTSKSRSNNRSDQSRLKPHETVALLLNSHAAVDVRKINLMRVEDVLTEHTLLNNV